MHWTDERTALLKRLWPTGMTAAQIAAEIGDVSRNSVLGKVDRLGLEARRLSFAWRAPDPKKPRPPRNRPFRQSTRPTAKTPILAYATDADIPLNQRRALLDLEPHHCRFPIGTPGVDLFFCGGPADLPKGRPYCPFHESVAYTKPKQSAHIIDIHTCMRLAKRQAEQEIRARGGQAA